MRLIKYAHACVRLESDRGVLVIDPGVFSDGRRSTAPTPSWSPTSIRTTQRSTRSSTQRASGPSCACSPTPRWRRSWTRVAGSVIAVAPGERSRRPGTRCGRSGGRMPRSTPISRWWRTSASSSTASSTTRATRWRCRGRHSGHLARAGLGAMAEDLGGDRLHPRGRAPPCVRDPRGLYNDTGLGLVDNLFRRLGRTDFRRLTAGEASHSRLTTQVADRVIPGVRCSRIDSCDPRAHRRGRRGRVYELDTAWSTDPHTLRRARLLELSGWAFYVAGRGGVLGDDVRADTVAAAHRRDRAGRGAGRLGRRPQGRAGAVAAARLAECARWGDEHLVDVAADDRLADLAERVVVARRAGGDAAVRRHPGDDRHRRRRGRPGRRAASTCCASTGPAALLVAIRACGLTPGRGDHRRSGGGAGGDHVRLAAAVPDPVSLCAGYTYAEALADRIAGAAYAATRAAERVELLPARRGRGSSDAAGRWLALRIRGCGRTWSR